MVGTYLRYFTFLSHEEIDALDVETCRTASTPAGRRALASAVVSLVHGDAEVTKCESASEALFTQEIASLSEDMLLAVTEDAPSSEISRHVIGEGLSLVDALVQSGLAKSRGDARRTIEGGGAYVNNVQQSDVARVLGPEDLLHDRYIVVRKGRHDVHVLRAASE